MKYQLNPITVLPYILLYKTKSAKYLGTSSGLSLNLHKCLYCLVSLLDILELKFFKRLINTRWTHFEAYFIIKDMFLLPNSEWHIFGQ